MKSIRLIFCVIFTVIFFLSIFYIQTADARRSGGGGSYKSSKSSSRSHTTNVRPHTTKKGTYVPAHKRTTPNKNKRDNWSTKGNENPYTGKKGTKNPD